MKNQLTPVLPGAPDQDNQGKKHGPNSLSNSPSHLQETDGAGGGNSGISDKKEDQEDRASLSDKKTKDSFTTRAKNFLKTVKDYIRGLSRILIFLKKLKNIFIFQYFGEFR